MHPVSPLAGRLAPGRHGLADGPPGVVLVERPPAAMAAIALRAGQGEALAERFRAAFGLVPPLRPGRVAAGPLALVWHGPGQWLALRDGPEGASRFGLARGLAERLGATASVTELTGARAVLRLSGPRVRDALAKLVPVDLDECAFPPGAAALTVAGHVGVALWRLEGAGTTFEIACGRSLGASLAEALLDAAAEFGCLVDAPP